MTNTLVTFLLDRSGSMESTKDDTIGAFNAYLGGMRGEPGIDFTLVQFYSMGIDKVCVREPIKSAPELSKDNFQPRGSTPLIDAAYKTIKAVEAAVGDDKETKVVICILTDGHENCSAEHTWADLNALIKDKTALGWQFNFMGAGIDAYDQGAKMGISSVNTMSYDSADPVAMASAFRGRASATVAYASGLSSNLSIGDAEKQAAGDRFVKPSAKPAATKRQAVDNFSL